MGVASFKLKQVVPEDGVVASSVYAGGTRVADIAVDDIAGWAKRPGHTVWIGLLEPSLEPCERIIAHRGVPRQWTRQCWSGASRRQVMMFAK